MGKLSERGKIFVAFQTRRRIFQLKFSFRNILLGNADGQLIATSDSFLETFDCQIGTDIFVYEAHRHRQPRLLPGAHSICAHDESCLATRVKQTLPDAAFGHAISRLMTA